MILDEAMRIAEEYGNSGSNKVLCALNELRAFVRVEEAAERARIACERDLLDEDQLAEYDSQCALLKAQDEEPISVAEYLKCRLDDANDAIIGLRVAMGGDES